jgi:DNA oxidative demethylase
MRGVLEEPTGLRYLPGLLGEADERELLDRLADLDYSEVHMRGQTARRVVRHYGHSYAFDSASITPGDPVPDWLQGLQQACAALLDRPAAALEEVLVTRYPPGATIGWHRDAPVFGDVVGVSLGSESVLRFQRGTGEQRRVFEQHLDPRSAYVLSGRARTVWQHSIPAVPAERYSLTFRTLRRRGGEPGTGR